MRVTLRTSSLSFGFFLYSFPVFAWTLAGQGLRGWQSSTLTINYNSSGCSISASALRDGIDQAIQAWNETPNSQLTLVRGATEVSTTVAQFLAGTGPRTPLILCDANFAANHGVSADSIPALTRLGVNNPIDYGAIILNSEASGLANVANFTAAVFALTLAHELGHELGLGHSQTRSALMYYSIANKTSFTLSQDDRDGIAYLYPREEYGGGFFGCSAVNKPLHGINAWASVFSLLLILVLGRSFGRTFVKPEPLL